VLVTGVQTCALPISQPLCVSRNSLAIVTVLSVDPVSQMQKQSTIFDTASRHLFRIFSSFFTIKIRTIFIL